jgi:hypothetical protein
METAVKNLLALRKALRGDQAVSSPAYISENMQRLAQYISAVEEPLFEMEKELSVLESNLFRSYVLEGSSANAASVRVGHELADQKAEIQRLSKLVSSSWKLIGASQSRIKHLIAEANNQY